MSHHRHPTLLAALVVFLGTVSSGMGGGKAFEAVAINDTTGLKARVGRAVEVTGIVSLVGTSKSKFITFITFEGVQQGGVTAIVKSANLAEIERVVGSNLDAALPGRQVAVRGVITFYKDDPQIEIESGEQIKISP